MPTNRMGKTAEDIFAPTASDATEVTVGLEEDHIAFLDDLAEMVAESRGFAPDRAEVIRHLITMVDQQGWLRRGKHG